MNTTGFVIKLTGVFVNESSNEWLFGFVNRARCVVVLCR